MGAQYVHSYEDEIKDVSTYVLDDGSRVRIANRTIRQLGAAEAIYRMGLGPNPAMLPRKPLYWLDRKIGTVPGSFDPRTVRSRSPFYDPRPGDFVPEGDGWRASNSLGPGDIEAIEGLAPG